MQNPKSEIENPKSLRVLYLGSFRAAWSTENYIANAFTRLGHDVVRLEESRTNHADIVARAAALEPDAFLFAKARFAEANKGWPADARAVVALIEAVRSHVASHPQAGTRRECAGSTIDESSLGDSLPRSQIITTGRLTPPARLTVICWLFDLLCAEFSHERFAWAEQVSAACDLFATTDGYTAPKLANAAVVRQGVPDDVDLTASWPTEYRGDILFLGTPYRDRWPLIEKLTRRFGPRFTCVRDCRRAALTELVRSYRICLGPHYPHFGGYWSNRIYVVTGHGGLFAAPPVDGMQYEGWQPGVNYLPLPLDPDGIVDALDEYLQRDQGELRSIRHAGFEHAPASCSYDRRVFELLALTAVQR